MSSPAYALDTDSRLNPPDEAPDLTHDAKCEIWNDAMDVIDRLHELQERYEEETTPFRDGEYWPGEAESCEAIADAIRALEEEFGSRKRTGAAQHSNATP